MTESKHFLTDTNQTLDGDDIRIYESDKRLVYPILSSLITATSVSSINGSIDAGNIAYTDPRNFSAWVSGGVETYRLLLENGDRLLTEDADYLRI